MRRVFAAPPEEIEVVLPPNKLGQRQENDNDDILSSLFV
jgi:hypothetical protein